MTTNGIDSLQPLSALHSENQDNNKLRVFQSCSYLLAQLLICLVVSGALIFVFNDGVPSGATPQHITLCVLGYQLLMAQAILSLSPHNSWSIHLRIVDKRRAHWILQILGSGLAIAGTFIKILDKSVHFDTYHGQFGLVALVFTTISLVNGLASLWAYEIRKLIPILGKLSKLSHICFGVVAFSMASITLCHGFEKSFFRGILGDGVGYTLIGFTACFTIIIIINPLINFVTKIKGE
ncbi:unnamed protein product [Arctia plantaginis]|uniref:ascorbate ferrireductase (transmembrane) n=1 Tax=Arctia plantaginis TaxID=874455 RepID=A0A8S1BBH5_ARCPL|nr:unnamed protein product [Arctia plantaginis]